MAAKATIGHAEQCVEGGVGHARRRNIGRGSGEHQAHLGRYATKGSFHVGFSANASSFASMRRFYFVQTTTAPQRASEPPNPAASDAGPLYTSTAATSIIRSGNASLIRIPST